MKRQIFNLKERQMRESHMDRMKKRKTIIYRQKKRNKLLRKIVHMLYKNT